MVNSVSGVNSATNSSAAAAVSSTKDVEKTKKQDEEKAKKAEKTDNTDKNSKVYETKTEQSSYAYDRITIQNKVKEYIEKLKKEHDYPVVQEGLTKYLDLFKVDDFMKKYPNIKTEAEFNTIMYNETIKYL